MHLVLASSLAAIACAEEVADGGVVKPSDLVNDDACFTGDETECSLSLRQLRLQQPPVELGKDGAVATESIEGASTRDDVQHDMVGKDAEAFMQETSINERTNIAEAALEDSADEGHHHHHHHQAEKQLRWAPDSRYCLSVDNNVFGKGQKMQLWQCKAGMGQFFHYTPSEESTLLRSAAAPAFCVVVDGNSHHNGAKVQLWECDPYVQAQHWIMEHHGAGSVLIRNAAFPSKCLVVNGNEGYNGNKLQIWNCQGAEQFKQWVPTR